MNNRLNIGDIVQHFKREVLLKDKYIFDDSSLYIYKILNFAEHTEIKEKFVIY